MAASIDGKMSGQQTNLIDELETAFLDCLALMTSQDHFNMHDSDENRTSVENATQKFLELSKKTEAFFLRKRMQVSFQKPEQPLNEDNAELRAELARKDQLIERHMERLKRCQMILKDREGPNQPTPASQQQQHPGSQHQHQQSQSSQPMQSLGSHPSQQPQVQSHLSSTGSHLPQYGQSQQQHHMSQQQQQQQQPGVMGSGGQNPGLPYQGYSTTMQGQGSVAGQGLQSHSMGIGGQRQQPPPSYPQGPLAFLEQTTSNIGLPDNRR